MAKLVKAERIFNETRWMCKSHINNWGYEENVGFNSIGGEEVVHQRTLNDLRKVLAKRFYEVKMNEKYGIGTPEQRELEIKVLKMVETTINNRERTEKEFNEKYFKN